MKKLFTATATFLALYSAANAYTSQDIDIKILAQETKNEIYQNFIWDQELINKAQLESNKQCSDFITYQKDFNSSVNNKLYAFTRAPDDDKYRYKIQSIESEIDRLKSTINKLDSRLYTLERKVR